MSLVIDGIDGQEYEFDDHQAILVERIRKDRDNLQELLAARKETVIGILLRTIEQIGDENQAKDKRIAALEKEVTTLQAAKTQEMQVVDTAIGYLES